MKELITFTLAIMLGYYFFLYFSHPDKKKHKIPRLQIWRIEILPNIRIHSKSRIYHIHHWANLMIVCAVAALMFVNFESMQFLIVISGFALGGIIQGLRYPDRFQFRHRKTLEEQAKTNKA